MGEAEPIPRQNPEINFKEPTKGQIREATKEMRDEERSELARNAWEKRREYFERKQSLEPLIEDLKERAVREEISVEETIDRLEELEGNIEDRKSSLISRVFGFRNIRNLETQREETQEENIDRSQQLAQTIEDYNELKIRLDDRSELEEAKEMIDMFYSENQPVWQEYQEELSRRKVENVCKKHDCLIMHGMISGRNAPEANSIIKAHTDFEARLQILLGFQPTISCSSFKEGDGWDDLWSSGGIILKSGSIEKAYESDGGTKATGIKSRGENRVKGERVSQYIDQVINSDVRGYDELVTADVEVAGLYFISEFETTRDGPDRPSDRKMVKLALKYDLPLYEIRYGNIWQVDPSKVGYERELSRQEVDNDTILKQAPQLSGKDREKHRQEVLEHSPFKLDIESLPELHSAASYRLGRESFIRMIACSSPESIQGTPINRDDLPRELSQRLNENQSCQLLEATQNPDGIKKFYLSNDGQVYQVDFKRSGQRVDIVRLSRKYPGGDEMALYHKPGFVWQSEERIDSTEQYLGALNDNLTKVEKSDFYSDQERERSRQSILFAAYGFVQQGQELGMGEEVEPILEYITQFHPREYYQGLVDEKINDQGGLVVTEEDIRR